MKTIAIIAAALGLSAAVVPGVASAAPWQPIASRQANLDARIDQGIRSGALNRAEAGRLHAQLLDTVRLEGRYRRSGGLSVGERRDLDRRFDAISARIRVQKHDRQHRR